MSQWMQWGHLSVQDALSVIKPSKSPDRSPDRPTRPGSARLSSDGPSLRSGRARWMIGLALFTWLGGVASPAAAERSGRSGLRSAGRNSARAAGLAAVRGLEPWDRLKIRLEPRTSSPRVGDIPAGTTGVLLTGKQRKVAGALWREVEHQGVRGWVNGRFLTPDALEPGHAMLVGQGGSAVFDEDLVCVANAPAWKLIVDKDGTAAGTPGLGLATSDLRATVAEPAGKARRGEPAAWRMTLQDVEGVGVVTLTLKKTLRCHDGHSARPYAYAVITRQPNGTVMKGCCNLGLRGARMAIRD